jgi:hypothetical protein
MKRTSSEAQSGRTAPRRPRVAGVLVAGALALGGLCAAAPVASAAGAVTLPGSPLVVSIGSQGQCQSSYENAGNNFYPGGGTIGDCGFFLAFSKEGKEPVEGNKELKETLYGFEPVSLPELGGTARGLGATSYTEVSQGAPTGTGTAADPHKQVTVFKVSKEEQDTKAKLDYALVTETTTYVNGEPQFTSSFEVQNVTGQKLSELPELPELNPAPAETLKFHAIYAGDLYTDSSDFGTGVFLGGPPRFIGGQNSTTGVFGGFIEAGLPSPPWANYQTGCWSVVPEPLGRCPTTSPTDGGIWAAVKAAPEAAPEHEEVFNDDVDPNLIDNAVGVSWNSVTPGLAAGEKLTYSIINRAQIPSGLIVAPVSQTHVVGQSATITVTATDTVGTPYANRPLVYTIGGANPKSGSVTTNAAGVATLSYTGTKDGLDTAQLFLDLAGTGAQTTHDPASAAQINWTPAPPAPDSSYKVQSVKANSDGTITIIFVPTQNGTALVEVTVPTATISRRQAIAARAKRCKRNQVRIKGRCRPRTTISGKVKATGKAGVRLKVTVKPSHKLKSALRRGKKVGLTVKLTYESALGGRATAKSFHVTVRPKRKTKRG